MTSRRRFLVAGALSALIAPYATAQVRPARIGMLSGLSRDKSVLARPLLQALSDLGYREGGAMTLEFRYSEDPRDYSRLAGELIAVKCDLIFAFASELTARALRDTGTSIPVVFIATLYDPVKSGLVKSFARPGGNLTGIYLPLAPLAPKRVEVAQEILPSARRFLVLSDSDTRDQLAATKTAANARGLQLTIVEFAGRDYDLPAAFETGLRAGAEGFIALSSAGFQVRRAEISELILRHRLPAVGPGSMAGDPGILVSYHNDIARHIRRAAEMAVRILNGARAADIPVEQPDVFELVVNLRTAKSIGVKVPYSVLSRATRVIE